MRDGETRRDTNGRNHCINFFWGDIQDTVHNGFRLGSMNSFYKRGLKFRKG